MGHGELSSLERLSCLLRCPRPTNRLRRFRRCIASPYLSENVIIAPERSCETINESLANRVPDLPATLADPVYLAW